ncbi:serine/threonine-protein kinase [Dietzia psychralcaliphila]|uniref:non-specific serine/threonine protein kinase n=1 Tax=Dietzia psychralcaliphila TaxID=139021 RepID=A0AAD0JRE5_9ACTN|nr:serine/threonine-protein kinase [Dietzia psychralcaliphila]AWH94193.1 serine/threonine protein kinase [Dietzia psychralcaliphila]PTM89776.1 serine/threonine-protein kinase [Dietzia psychralcaliphila]
MSLNSGALLSGRYRLLRLIATGGMGQVWEADDAVLDRHVAVKVLKSEFSSDQEFVERFRSEAKVTARISHPGIATVYDYGQIDDPASGSPLSYLVMELVVGEPLSDVLSREGTLPLRHTLDMLEQTGRALNAAHAIGLVHRDVKPGNILITPSGQVKLTDFGIAKSMGSAAVTQAGMVVGTAQYIAPEQAMGHETTPAGDVYSLGVVGYECVSGRRPFVADSPVSVAMMHVRDTPPPLPDSVPPPVRRLLADAMVKEPGRRYPDGEAFAEAVADVRAGRDPRPPGAFITAAAAGGLLGGAAGAGAATAATTVLPDETPGPGSRPGADPTRAYTRLQPGPTTRTQGQPQYRTARAPVQTPARRHPAPPVTSRPPRRRGGAGCAGWFLIVVVLLAALAVAAAIALSNAGVFGPGGLFGGTTPSTSATTSEPPTPTTQAPAPAPAPAPEPTPTPQPAPSPTVVPPAPDLQDMLDSLTSEFSSFVPPGQAGDGDNSGGNANPNAGGVANNGRGGDGG